MGEGNIGTDPEVKLLSANGNQPPRGRLRLNVRFDNPVPTDIGSVDRGGFWANVEIWNRDVETWARLYQKGMRVMVSGRMVLDEWKDRKTGEDRSQFKVQAVRIGILPFRSYLNLPITALLHLLSKLLVIKVYQQPRSPISMTRMPSQPDRKVSGITQLEHLASDHSPLGTLCVRGETWIWPDINVEV